MKLAGFAGKAFGVEGLRPKRILWIHNPLDFDIEKARDPKINLRTLAKLSHCPDECVRKAAVENLAGRFHGANPAMLSRFDRGVVFSALAKSDYWKQINLRSFIQPDPGFRRLLRAMGGITNEEFSAIASACPRLGEYVMRDLLRDSSVPRETKVEILRRMTKSPWEVAEESLTYDAFLALKKDATPKELELLCTDLGNITGPQAHKVFLGVAEHPNCPSKTVASIISELTEKDKIIDVEGVTGYWVSDYEYALRGGDPAKRQSSYEFECGVPEQSHYEYGEGSAEYAGAVLNKHTGAKRTEILIELEKINPELAELLKK